MLDGDVRARDRTWDVNLDHGSWELTSHIAAMPFRAVWVKLTGRGGRMSWIGYLSPYCPLRSCCELWQSSSRSSYGLYS